MVSAADIAAITGKLKAEHKDQATMGQALLQSGGGYNVALEYRTAVANPAVHEHDAEFFYVIDGSATLTTGGKLANEKRTNPANLTGTGIEGGQSRVSRRATSSWCRRDSRTGSAPSTAPSC